MDVLAHLVKRAAVVDRIEGGELLSSGLDRGCELDEAGRPLRGLEPTPVLLCKVGGPHRRIDVLCTAPGNRARSPLRSPD